MGSDGGLCDGGRRQAVDRGVPGWDGDVILTVQSNDIFYLSNLKFRNVIHYIHFAVMAKFSALASVWK